MQLIRDNLTLWTSEMEDENNDEWLLIINYLIRSFIIMEDWGEIKHNIEHKTV